MTEPVVDRRPGIPAVWGRSIVSFLILLAAFVLFLLLAFEAFHGKAIVKAEFVGFAAFVLGVAIP